MYNLSPKILILIGVFLLPFLGHANENVEKSPAAENSDTSSVTESDIESIVVYAQKRPQNTLDVAVAVTSLDGEEIEKQYIKDTTQLDVLVPNLKITNNAGEGTTPSFNIRGIGMMDYNTSTISPIAIYSDGVVGGSANNLSSSLYDIEYVEVLRGPQGTLFGRNTTGGAILLNSKMPIQEFEGYISAGIAENDHTSLSGALNVPFSETTAVRLAFNQEDYDYSTNNLMPDQSDGGMKKTNVRLILLSELENLTITAKIEQADWDGTSKPVGSLGINREGGGENCTPSELGNSYCLDNFGAYNGGNDYWEVIADNADRTNDTDSWGTSLTLAWQINPNTTLTSISGYKELDRDHGWDSDGPGNLIEGSMGTESSVFSQELTLAMQLGDIYWISGIFYFDEEINQDNDIDLFRDFRPYAGSQFFYDNTLDNTATALYTQVDYPLSSSLTVTAGLRYTDEKTDYHTISDLDTSDGYISEFWNIKGSVEDDEFSGKLALTQKLDDFTSIYYSYSRGYKSGGYNAGYNTSPAQALDQEYKPEKLNAYEVGTKLILLEQQIRLNLAAFYYDYKDQQIFVNVPSVQPFHVLKNAGDSTIYGLEGEFTYTPTQNLDLNLNVGYLPEANIGSYDNGYLSVETDNRLPFASDWNVSGYALYEMEIFSGLLISQLSFDYQSDFYFDQNENSYTQQDDFILFNGRVTFQANEQLEFSLWGKNLTDEEHSELLFDSTAALGAITELKADGRKIGAEVKYSF